MGLSEKDARLLLGQVFAMRLPSELDRLDPDRFPVANYIVFEDAIGTSLDEAGEHLGEVRCGLRRHGVEPLFMMDEEGGRVSQVARSLPSAPSARAVSRHLQPAEAGTLYRYMSEVLSDIGVDINLAPCMDTNTEPMNPIIGCRAFGAEREMVETYGRAFIRTSMQHLACVAKHFPGHGVTTADSHLDMPVVDVSREDLETIHIPPFVSAVKAGAEGIMISHCCYTALQDEVIPASLSKEIIGKLLRRDIGFNGVVITDSLDMDAVTARLDAAEASRAALSAGADILLYTEASPRFEGAFETLVADAVSGRLDPQKLAESISRRQAVLKRVGAIPRPEERIPRERYMELRRKVMSASVRTYVTPEVPLPLRASEVAWIFADTGLPRGAHRGPEPPKSIGRAEDARNKVLLLWLVEPLRLKHSLTEIRRMIDAARLSVLVTSYPALADALGACEAKIVTDDTSPETQAAILRRLFG